MSGGSGKQCFEGETELTNHNLWRFAYAECNITFPIPGTDGSWNCRGIHYVDTTLPNGDIYSAAAAQVMNEALKRLESHKQEAAEALLQNLQYGHYCGAFWPEPQVQGRYISFSVWRKSATNPSSQWWLLAKMY